MIRALLEVTSLSNLNCLLAGTVVLTKNSGVQKVWKSVEHTSDAGECFFNAFSRLSASCLNKCVF